ncbi:hypothetical protein Hanom_Chr10g00883521 [Helianthus anomalus]
MPNNNPNVVFSLITQAQLQAQKTNYVYDMSPQATVNTSATPTSAQHYPQHANGVFSPANPSSSQNTPSPPSVESIIQMLFAKQNEEKRALTASMLNNLNAFLAGDLLPPSILATDINQVVKEDIEKLDASWNLAMMALQAKIFQKSMVFVLYQTFAPEL